MKIRKVEEAKRNSKGQFEPETVGAIWRECGTFKCIINDGSSWGFRKLQQAVDYCTKHGTEPVRFTGFDR